MIPLLLLAVAPCTITRGAWPAEALPVETAVRRLQDVCRGGVSIEIAKRNVPDPEGYVIEAAHPKYVIAASSPRGILYGAYAAAGQFERGAKPMAGSFAPRFRMREWWSAAFQANFNLPLGGAFDRPIEEISGIVERTIHEGPKYGINTLQLMGRAGEGGIDLSWFLRYDDFPKLKGLEIGWGMERRTAEIRRLAKEAHRYGMDFLLWDHELVFPDRMVEAYPEMRGLDYPICFSHPLVMRFLNSKIDEFFRRLPEVDGLNLTFAETRGYNILEHGGCRCEQCSRLSTDRKLRMVVMAVYDACRRNGKRLEVRSYNQLPEHAKVMGLALKGLPPEIPIVTKNTVVDFRGVGYPDNPMLGAFPGQPETLELTATPEGSGYGYIPALLGDFYQREIGDVAVNRKLAGIAIRSDYHLQYGHATAFTSGPPILTFDTPNDFNLYAASRLAWDPALRVDDLWPEWSSRRYGSKAVPVVERALRRTAAISQGIFFVKGFSLLTHLNMVPHLATIDAELDKSYLLQFFPHNAEYQRVYRELKQPSEETIRAILAEKQAAADAARQSRHEIQTVRGDMPAAEFTRLDRGLRLSENAARLWREIADVYFRVRAGDKSKLEPAVRALVAESCRIEKEEGKVWPVYPAARGTTAYQFATEAMERGGICCIPASCQ